MSKNFDFEVEITKLSLKLAGELNISQNNADEIVKEAGQEVAKKIGKQMIKELDDKSHFALIAETVDLIVGDLKSGLTSDNKIPEVDEIFSRLASIDSWQNLFEDFTGEIEKVEPDTK